MSGKKQPPKHIKLTSHPTTTQEVVPITWGAKTPAERGPVIGTLTDPARRNAIGAHSGSYALYRALAVAAGTLDPVHKPDLTDTAPTEHIGPFFNVQGIQRAKAMRAMLVSASSGDFFL